MSSSSCGTLLPIRIQILCLEIHCTISIFIIYLIFYVWRIIFVLSVLFTCKCICTAHFVFFFHFQLILAFFASSQLKTNMLYVLYFEKLVFNIEMQVWIESFDLHFGNNKVKLDAQNLICNEKKIFEETNCAVNFQFLYRYDTQKNVQSSGEQLNFSLDL